MLCLQGLPHVVIQKSRGLSCLLLATVSTLSFAPSGAFAATQTIRGSFQGQRPVSLMLLRLLLAEL